MMDSSKRLFSPLRGQQRTVNVYLVTFTQSPSNLKPSAGAQGAVVLPITAARGQHWATIGNLCSLNLTFIQEWAADTECTLKAAGYWWKSV